MKELSPIEKAIEYIETHLDENIGLSDVSRITGYSYYHLTRLFSSVLGESAGHYINRRRLYKASEKLIHSRQKIIDIAFESGFRSPEAFSRAFKAVFGCSPADYRKTGLDLVVNAKRGLAPADVRHIADRITHSPQFRQVSKLKTAGIRGTTSLFNNSLPQLWEQFLSLDSDLFVSGGERYCICETLNTVYSEDGNVSFSVMLGGAVKNLGSIPPGLDTKIISPGRYAVFTHRGALSSLLKTYQYIYGTWLPSSQEELDDREDFEVYRHQVLSPDAPDNEVEIFIPVK